MEKDTIETENSKTVRIDPDTHRDLKVHTAENELSMVDFLRDAIREKIERDKKKNKK